MSLIITILAAGNHKYSLGLLFMVVIILLRVPPFRFLAKKWRCNLKNVAAGELIWVRVSAHVILVRRINYWCRVHAGLQFDHYKLFEQIGHKGRNGRNIKIF
jgi:hypothetical protein